MIKEWIIKWFNKNSNISIETLEKKSNENYFEEKWIDSFAFINFLSDVEEHYNIKFSNDEFQNRDFSTIDGLANIIGNKLNG